MLLSYEDSLICEIEKNIDSLDEESAKSLYERVCKAFDHKIVGLELGTHALFKKVNLRWNFNDGVDMIGEDDYINDLKIVINRIKKHIKCPK